MEIQNTIQGVRYHIIYINVYIKTYPE